MVPVLILAGTTIASIAALAYDYVKETNKAPDIIINTETVSQTDSKSSVAQKVRIHLLMAAAVGFVWWKFIRKKR